MEAAREDLAPAAALFGRAADANTALLATQEAIFSACEEKRTATRVRFGIRPRAEAAEHVAGGGPEWPPADAAVTRAIERNLES